MKRFAIDLSCMAMIFVLGSSWAWGQTAEEHSVEHLEVSELGEFEPEKRPTLDQVEQLIVEQTNDFRQKQGREPVEVNETLKETATQFAEYMARTDKYGHQADGRQPSERAKAQGYDYCLVSENIAYQFKTTGYTTQKLAQGFVEGWINSPPHRRNMLERAVTDIGVAVAQSEKTGVFYAVQMFGRPKSKKIEFRLVNKANVKFKYQVANKQFTLPPNYARRHTLCRPSKLRWLPVLQSEDSQDSETRTREPKDGAEYRVAIEGDKVLLQPTPSDETE